MVLFWAIDVLLIIWTVAFVNSQFFHERFTRAEAPKTPKANAKAPKAPAPKAVVVTTDGWARDETGELPSLLARALEQVEDQTYSVARNDLKWPDAAVTNSRS